MCGPLVNTLVVREEPDNKTGERKKGVTSPISKRSVNASIRRVVIYLTPSSSEHTK